MRKKFLILFATLFGLLVTYRLFQYNQWSKNHKTVEVLKGGRIDVRIRKLHVLDDTLFHPSDYTEPMIKSSYVIHNGNDTLYLKSTDKQIVEFEVLGSSNVKFNSIDLLVWENGSQQRIKPSISRNQDSYSISNKKILFAFRPWVYTSDMHDLVHVLITSNVGQLKIPIKVLEKLSYDNYISNRLTVQQRAAWNKVKAKYTRRLASSWRNERFSSGRKSYYNASFSTDTFFAGKKYKRGKFTNEYVAKDGDYRIVLFIDHSPSVIVEPINVML